jgi:hypothetical protein
MRDDSSPDRPVKRVVTRPSTGRSVAWSMATGDASGPARPSLPGFRGAKHRPGTMPSSAQIEWSERNSAPRVHLKPGMTLARDPCSSNSGLVKVIKKMKEDQRRRKWHQ